MSKVVKLTPEEELKLRLIQDQHRQARRKARLVGAVAAVLATWFFVYIIFFAGSDNAPVAEVEGEITVRESEHGSFKLDLEPRTCRLAPDAGTHIVDLPPVDGAWTVRIHPDSQVELRSDGKKIELSSEMCDPFELSMEHQQGRSEGSLKLTCVWDSGQVSGWARFQGCE